MGSFQYGSLVLQTATTATAAGTTTLVNTSKQNQIFTGTAIQTIVLPDATTMSVGQSFNLYNQSTGTLTINFNGGAAFTDASGKNYNLISANTSLFIVLQTNGTSAGTWAVLSASAAGLGAPGPTVQKFTSGSGTYTTPANVSFIRVRMVGAGGGGAGSSSGANDGGNGGTSASDTTFGAHTAGKGTGATGGGSQSGGAGGTATIGAGGIGTGLTGATGSDGAGASITTFAVGGMGGNSAFGGAGGGGFIANGHAGITNTGGGGGGAGSPSSAAADAGSGGGAGAYVDIMIVTPSATYSYGMGAGGTGGTAGTNGHAGGAGGSGYIEVTEYYFNGLGASGGNGGAYTPTIQKFTTGTAQTYTTPVNVSFIRVRMVGGGGGGGGSGTTSGTSSTVGTASTFGTSLLSAGGGGNAGRGGGGASGGTSSLGSGPIGTALPGGPGTGGGSQGSAVTTASPALPGGAGGNSAFGGGGNGGDTITNAAGGNAPANTGGGGGGAAINATSSSETGPGGGAGGFVDAIIISPASTYTYTVGAGGTGQAAGSSGSAGGNGASGYIEVTEYYNNGAVGTATQITGSVTNTNLNSVGTATSFTPVFNGFGTVSQVSCWYTQFGKFIRIYGSFKSGTVAASTASIDISSIFTIDSTKLPGTAVQRLGTWQQIRTAAGPAGSPPWTIFYDGSDTAKVYLNDNATGSNVYVKENGSSLLNTNDSGSFEFTVIVL